MKNLLLASTLLAGLLLVGCGPKSETNGNVNATAAGGNVCPAGYWYSNGQCYNGNNSQGAGNQLNNGFYSDNYSNTTSFRITNSAIMKNLFKKGMGVCDLAHSNLGQANCDAYIRGYVDVIIQLPSSTSGSAVATIIARPYQDPYFNFYGQLPSARGLLGLALGWVTGIYIPEPSYYQGAYRNPLQIQMAVSPINNSQGFQANGFGDAWTGLNQTTVSIQVMNGSVNSTNLNYKLLIGHQEAAEGTMRRCQTMNCGL